MRAGYFLVYWGFLALHRRFDLSAFRSWSNYVEILDCLTNIFPILDYSFLWGILALPRCLSLSAFRIWPTYVGGLGLLPSGLPISDLPFGFLLLLLLCFDVVAALVDYVAARRAGRFGIDLLRFASRGGLSAA